MLHRGRERPQQQSCSCDLHQRIAMASDLNVGGISGAITVVTILRSVLHNPMVTIAKITGLHKC